MVEGVANWVSSTPGSPITDIVFPSINNSKSSSRLPPLRDLESRREWFPQITPRTWKYELADEARSTRDIVHKVVDERGRRLFPLDEFRARFEVRLETWKSIGRDASIAIFPENVIILIDSFFF